MNDDLRERVRDAIMDTFREWGGQWNVTAQPADDDDPDAGRWLVRVHSRPIVRESVPAEVIDAYMSDPSDADASARWEAALRPIFEQARGAGQD